MRLSLLPDYKSKQDYADEKQYFTIDFKDNTPDFVKKNALPVLAFCLPILIIGILMNLMQFAPFGDKSFFVQDAFSQFMYLHKHIHSQLQQGTFSFLSSSLFSNDLLYLFFLFFSSPLHFLALFFPTEGALIYLQMITLFEIGLSGYLFAYYLTHRTTAHRYASNDACVLLFSLAYAMSGFVLTRYNDFIFLEIAALFPLIMLSFEQLMHEQKQVPFRSLIVICFVLQFYMTCIVLLFLLFYLFAQDYRKTDSNLSLLLYRVLYYLKNCMICVFLAAPILIPGLYLYVQSQVKGTTIADFVFAKDWLTFFSRFLPANTVSYSLALLSHGNYMYIGLPILFLLPIYFFTRSNSLQSKLKAFFFILLLLMTVNQSQTQYIFRLFNNNELLINGYSFIVLFFILMYSANSLYSCKDTNRILCIIAYLIPVILFFLAVRFGKGTIRSACIQVSLILFALYGILFALYLLRSISPATFYGLLFLSLLIELSINSCTILQDIKSLSSPIDECAASIPEPETVQNQPFASIAESYSLPDYYLSDTQANELSETGSMFDAENEMAAFLDKDAILFSKATPTITAKKIPEDIDCKISTNNILTLGPKSIKQADYQDETDSLEEDTKPTTITLQITPDQTGDLYLFIEEFIHIGQVEKGVPFTYDFTTTPAAKFYSNYYIQGGYLNEEALNRIQNQVETSDVNLITFQPFSVSLEKEFEKDGDFVINFPYCSLLRAEVDRKAVPVKESLCHTSAVPVSKGKHTIRYKLNFTPFYIGLLLSVFTISFLLLRYKAGFLNLCERMEQYMIRFCRKITSFTAKHKPAILSFCIPLLVLLFGAFIASCTPFGSKGWLHNDGFLLTYAMLIQRRHELLSGNILYSWTMGSGTNIYNTMPNTILSIWLLLVPEKYLFQVLSFLSMIKIALCSLSMYFYLTRSKKRKALPKKDSFLLFFTCAYALSAYVINMSSYFHWLTVFALFPLILLALEKLMLKKNALLYILLLALSIISDYNTSLFICIFLVFWFFTFHFTSIKDFISKGLLFAFSSILSVGMSFWILHALISNLNISPYSSTDSQNPAWLFYQSFWDSLKQLMPFSSMVVITENNGAINLYCGTLIVVLLLTSVFLLRHNRCLIYKWFILLFLLLSSNNELLSYLWNGCHYQIMVPNRYAFLTVFLMIDIAFEAYQHRYTVKKWQYAVTTLITVCFYYLVITNATDKPSKESIVMTLISLIFYFSVLWYVLLFRKKRRRLQMATLLFSIMELAVCICYVNLGSSELCLANYETPVIDHIKEAFPMNQLERMNYCIPYTTNVGTMYSTPSIEQFNSYLTRYQYNMANYNGSAHTANMINSTTSQTPFALSMSNVRYILLDTLSTVNTVDFDHYEIIDYYNGRILLENKRVFSPAFYLPENAKNSIQKANTHTAFANLLCRDVGLSKFIFSNIELLQEETAENKNYIICTQNTQESGNKDVAKESNTYQQEIHFTPSESGPYFYAAEEYHYLGWLEENKEYIFYLSSNFDYGSICKYNDDVMQAFYDKLAPYTLRLTEQTNTLLEGEITLPEDGIINFSIPYEPGWRAYLDGVEVETHALENSYLYIDAPKGTHTVTLRFFPTSLKPGVIITLLSWLVYILYIILYTQKNKRTLTDESLQSE